jgi:hypothetical protein
MSTASMEKTEHSVLYKFGPTSPEALAWKPGKIFARENHGSTPHLMVAAASGQVQLLEALLNKMPEPYWLLYVLVVPRGEGEPGRYQSPTPLSRSELISLLSRFRNFFETDGRHNVWIKSESGPALLVLDRHNIVYAYGFEGEWSSELREMGWTEVDGKAIALPDPHAHYYHEIFDDDARNVLGEMEWSHSPLREQDT